MKKLLTIALAASMTLALSVNSFALGNYVLSTEELGNEEELPPEDEEIVPEEKEDVPAPDEAEKVEKPNPDTGADDFAGIAAAAAVIAGIGFTVLKKR